MEKFRNHVSHRTLGNVTGSTVSKRVLILRTWSLIRNFMAFWVLIFQGPYFHYLVFIHTKNVIFAGIGSGLLC